MSQLEPSLHLTKPKEWAAGIQGVAVSLRHVLGEMGMVRGARGLMEMNQTGGFDCPSCAWPDPDGDRSKAEFCENGAKALASEATRTLADATFFANHSVEDLAAQSDFWHNQQGRIAQPMILRQGSTHYQPVSWEEAILVVAKELQALSDPDEAIFYTSGRASNEAAFLYQLFARSFGTNNLPDCSNMCHESSGLAMNEAIGVGKGTVTLADFLEADTILCVGQNPGTNHPRMLSTLEAAVKRGAKIVSINPLKEAGLVGFVHPQHPVAALLGRPTALASQFLRVRVNGDLALFRGVAKSLLEDEITHSGGVIDMAFLHDHTDGFQTYQALVEKTDWAEIVRMSGVEELEIRELATTLQAGLRRVITCWAMGLTQHKNAVATIREVVNVHLLLGAIGRAGAGLCPVRGHSNVQGDRTMGIFEKMPESFLAALDRECGIQSPRKHGYDTVAAIHAMHRGEAKVFFALGGNFLQATPDTEFTADALRRCELTCHVSTKLNRSHLVTGKTALILPCLGRSEVDGDGQFVTCENSMGVVQMSQGTLAPVSPDLLSEVEIICRLAEAVNRSRSIPWRWLGEDYDRIRNLIERVVPGFDRFNERVLRPAGFYLPNSAKERRWDTPSGKACFGHAEMDVFEVPRGRLVLQTLRSHDQFNTTIYGMDDRYRGIGNARRIVLVNPDDLRDREIQACSPVDLISFWGDERRVAKQFLAIPYEMPRGSAAAYFPEANVLVPIASQADGSGTPTSKAIEIEIVIAS
jgi:molybdopterin-dependent oxidoreductase alpha subunit